jgi:hypothetical protein
LEFSFSVFNLLLMLVMMRAERGTQVVAAAEAAACRRKCRACRGLAVGLGAANIDADVDRGRDKQTEER